MNNNSRFQVPKVAWLALVVALLAAACSDLLPGPSLTDDTTPTTDTTPPASVTSLAATAGDGQVALTWTNPADTDFAGLAVTWTPESPSVAQPIPLEATSTGTIVIGLTNGTSYTFTVTCLDASGNLSEGKSIAAVPVATPMPDTTAPADASAVTATAGDTQVALSWTNPGDTDFAGTELTWTPTDGSAAQPLSLAASATSQTITGLSFGTSYTFTLKSVDTSANKSSGVSLGSTPGELASATLGTLKAIAGGTFAFRSTSVTLSNFRMSTTEITQAQYRAVTGVNPSRFTGDSLPVEMVSWYDAVSFCNALSTLEGLTPVYGITGITDSQVAGYGTSATVTMDRSVNGYRLPTEAEWEFAARGGNRTHDYTYAGSNTIGDVAWYKDNSNLATQPVGTKAANELGLFDLTGNVWEWCWDWRPGSGYVVAQTDPTGPVSGLYRVLKGADLGTASNSSNPRSNWGNFPDYLGGYQNPSTHNEFGFRVVRQ